MAVVGCGVAHLSYQLISGRSEPGSYRRQVAAGLAGYLAINCSALLTAFEFGIQPLWFHDASGTPLYAPYPLSVAVPAMMVGHLSFAGMAEGLLTAGLFAWLQRSHSPLLRIRPAAPRGPATRSLGYLLVGLMLLSPLGLLASGSAWGEWASEAFSDQASRATIIQASAHAELPQRAPQGLAQLATIWSAPVPDYAPAFIADLKLGYLVAAMLGCALIVLSFLLIARGVSRGVSKRADAL